MPWFERPAGTQKVVNWKTNLVALWASQFISLSAFSFCLPFMALYLRESGIVPPDKAAQWSGILQSVSSVSMVVFAPIWGMLGDKYGRKMMLVRANLAGGFVLYLTALVENVEALIVLRILHGAFTGTVAAAQSLVATNTPDRNQGFAIGVIMAAVSAGQAAGNFFGGLCAEHFGPVVSFKVGGVMLLVSTVMVVFSVKETFVRPEPLPHPTPSVRIRRRQESVNNFKSGLPILGVVSLVSFVQVYDGPFLPLYIDSLYAAAQGIVATAPDGAIDGRVYGLTGTVGLVATIAAMIGSTAAGVLMDRKIPPWVWVVLPALCGAGALWIALQPTFWGLVAGRSLFLMISSSLASVVIVVLGRMTPNSRRGAAMGWSQAARSVGWSTSPILGALISQRFGWMNAFLVLAGLTALLIPAFIFLHRRYQQAFLPMEEDPPSITPVADNEVSKPGGQGRV